jgi:hypothetical protein
MKTYASGFSVKNMTTPMMYCIIRYTTAAETEIRPLANGLFLVRSTKAVMINPEYDAISRTARLTNASVHPAVEYVIHGTSRASDNESGAKALD